MIQIIRVEPGKNAKPDDVIETNTAPLKGEQTCFAQMAQNPVDMHGTQAQRIGQMILRQRARESALIAYAHKSEARTQFQHEMRHAHIRRTPPKIDQMFGHHRLVARDVAPST